MTVDNTKDMTTGSPARLLLTFSMPLMLGNLFQQLYTFVDALIVGQRVSANALAALGATEWLIGSDIVICVYWHWDFRCCIVSMCLEHVFKAWETP